MLVSTSRLGALFLLRGSALAYIWPWLLVIGLTSVVLTFVAETWQLERFEITLAPFTIVGLALSIFLGFRNSACYDRWWEGRKLWGRLINTSRSFTRQVLTLVRAEGPEVEALRRELVYRMMGYAHALRLHLRAQDRLSELEPFLPSEEIEALRAERNRPIAILQGTGDRLRAAMDRGWIDRFHLPVLEATLTDLTDIQGGCERIKNTPVPLSYTELTHRIVALYVLALPFALVAQLQGLTPLVVIVVAYCFLGLDAVGSQIENPFEEDPNDLPLSALSRLIEKDLRQRLGETELPPDVTPVHNILL